ncbi:hypothetical protein T492DRAFT_1089063, partial [Pavlovales sp. CCMP2436]
MVSRSRALALLVALLLAGPDCWAKPAGPPAESGDTAPAAVEPLDRPLEDGGEGDGEDGSEGQDEGDGEDGEGPDDDDEAPDDGERAPGGSDAADDEPNVGAAAATEPAGWVPIPERPKLPQPQYATGPKQPCSRAKSREARQIVDERLIAKALSYGVQIDRRCKLHPDNDLLRPHEANKSMASSSQWRCKTCGKVFRTEAYIDMHMDRKHADTLPANRNVCPADFCDILGCRSAVLGGGAGCSEKLMQRRRVLCQHLMHNCFPPSLNAEYWHVHEWFEHELCDQLTCGPAISATSASGAARVLRIVGTVIVVLLATVIGLGIWCHRMEACTGPDLRRRSGRAKSARGSGIGALLRRVGFGGARAHLD